MVLLSTLLLFCTLLVAFASEVMLFCLTKAGRPCIHAHVAVCYVVALWMHLFVFVGISVPDFVWGPWYKTPTEVVFIAFFLAF